MKKILSLACVLLFVCSSIATGTISIFAKDSYTGDGQVAQEFTITFEFFKTDEIVATTRVTATGAEAAPLTETTDYTIAGTGSSPYTGGTLTLVSSLAATSTITISRSMDQNQETDLETSGTLPADSLEDQYDKLAMQIQDLQEQINRSIRIPVTDLADDSTIEDDMELDDSVSRASTYLTFDSDGSISLVTGGLDTTVTTTTFTENLLDDANTATFQTTMGFSSFIRSLLDDADQSAAQTTLGLAAASQTLDNNTYLLSDNFAGTGTVNLIKSNTADEIVLGTHTTINGALTTGAGIFAGGVLAMDSNKITGMASGTASGDALHVGQLGGTTIELSSGNAEIVAGTVGATQMAAGAAWRTSGATVFNTVLGGVNTWQTLNLSSYVGANAALVFLEVASDGAMYFYAKPSTSYGSITVTNHLMTYASGGGNVQLPAGTPFTYMTMATHTDGKIQIAGNSTTPTLTIKLIGYLK